MIAAHLQPNDAFQPKELDTLQTSLDRLEARFEVASEDVEKAAIAILLLAAFRGSRDAEQAAMLTEAIYRQHRSEKEPHHSGG